MTFHGHPSIGVEHSHEHGAKPHEHHVHDYSISLDITEVPVEYWAAIDEQMHKLLEPIKEMFPNVRVRTDHYGLVACDEDHSDITARKVNKVVA